MLLKSDYYFDLPDELIAQTPAQKRDCSRLLVMDKKTGELTDRHFYDILDYITENDCLILNDSKVIPARLYAKKEDTGADIEIVLLKNHGNDNWETLVRPGKKAKIGTKLVFGGGILKAEIIDILQEGNRLLHFTYDGIFMEILDKVGNMPLPPYITRKLQDKTRYQTVYAKNDGSAAAPTAGLHFTKELLEKAKEKGIKIGYVTLHIGLGTFRPVKEDNILEHKMHSEFYILPSETADIINETHKNGGRVFCVGTTSTRTLEACASKNNKILPDSDNTEIFIYPGYEFKATDCLITNFHLPESTLIMLVSALAGRENVLNAYKHAVEQKYRFFSFGDAMLIV